MNVEPTAETLAGLETWRSAPVAQQATYPDEDALRDVLAELRACPPLIFAGEADKLRTLMADAGAGEAFILQGGDCAETFAQNTADRIRNKIRTILQMAVVLTYGASLPIVKMGRMAGQYAKPRSSDTETRDDVTLPCYRGDMVNAHGFTESERVPDPTRLLGAYHQSASTINLMRAFTGGGFADLRLVHEWNRGFIQNPAHSAYESMAAEIGRALKFMAAAGVDFEAIKSVDMYSSHEALHLEYEAALTRIDHRTGLPYGTSGHFLWIGERTRTLDGAHVEFLSRLQNPIGVKLGPTVSPDEVRGLIDTLNPEGVPGRLTFIARMGATKVRDHLGAIVEAVQADGRPVTWMSDPMHGNTFTSPSGYKTREMSTILDEVRGFFEVHKQLGTVPGGLHVELTGDDVTEVMGGADPIDDASLALRYETLVDPRLNHQQSLQIAFDVAEMLRG
ncbi:2-keto-3-deoxy-D-arabino-heptulosonate-7-phosphate synthase II [Actinomycetales bacterium JB111]|nr:2-keto-3-deoxy-D-arabino-heptulosonate-7-phosphate synthase II [Actinomycetales bacterium JB111]